MMKCSQAANKILTIDGNNSQGNFGYNFLNKFNIFSFKIFQVLHMVADIRKHSHENRERGKKKQRKKKSQLINPGSPFSLSHLSWLIPMHSCILLKSFIRRVELGLIYSYFCGKRDAHGYIFRCLAIVTHIELNQWIGSFNLPSQS